MKKRTIREKEANREWVVRVDISSEIVKEGLKKEESVMWRAFSAEWTMSAEPLGGEELGVLREAKGVQNQSGEPGRRQIKGSVVV